MRHVLETAQQPWRGKQAGGDAAPRAWPSMDRDGMHLGEGEGEGKGQSKGEGKGERCG